MQENRWRQKLVVTISGSLALLYCVIVLAYVATVPDLRLRVLLADDDRQDDPNSSGDVVRDVPGLLCRGPKPSAGDILVRIGDHRIRAFGDFAKSLLSLRRAAVDPGWVLKRGDDPSTVREPLPSVVDVENGQRL